MSAFDTYRPKLKTGTITEEADRVIFELGQPYCSVILPAASADMIRLFDGQHQVNDILRVIWFKNGKVRFKDLLLCLERLKNYDCLENPFEQKDRIERDDSTLTPKLHGIFRPFIDRVVLRRWRLEGKSRAGFYLLSILTVAMAIRFCAVFRGPMVFNDFLKIRGSYALGIIYFIAGASILISFKNVVKTILLLTGTGSASRGSLQANIFSFSYRIEDKGHLMTMRRADALVFTLASVAAPFAFLNVTGNWGGPFWTGLLPIAVIFSLVDMDPYLGSELTRLFKRFYADQNLHELIPYLRKRALTAIFDNKTKVENELLFTLFSTFAIIWTYTALYFCSKTVNSVFSNLMAALMAGPVAEKAAAALILASIGVVNFYLLADIFTLVLTNVLHPFTNTVLSLRRGLGAREGDAANSDVETIIGGMPLFAASDPAFIRHFLSLSKIRRFPKGSPLVIQGTDAGELFILLEGAINIYKREGTGYRRKLVEMEAPTVFGETGILEGHARTADVVAKTRVRVVEVPKTVFSENEKASPSAPLPSLEEERKKIIGRIMLQQYLSASSLFSDLPKETIQIFTKAGEFQNIPAGHVLFKQGETGDSFYLLVRGEIAVEINGKDLKHIREGGFFGEIALLTNSPRNATIRAVDESVVLKIGRESFWNVILNNINLAVCIEAVAEQRIIEDQMAAAGK